MKESLKQLIKRAKDYVEREARTKVKRISFAERFHLLGREDIVLSVITIDKKHPEWWVVGGSTPIILYVKSYFRTADEAFSMHTGLLLRMSADDFEQSQISAEDIGYDAFISHASEDKKAVVRPLAQALRKKGFRIWYDELELKVGDSLRESIDHGLSNSRYGVIILSPAFFNKKWTKYELNGLTAKEIDGKKVILPVWHNITKAQVLQYSPQLADKVAAVLKNKGITKIASQLAKVLSQ